MSLLLLNQQESRLTVFWISYIIKNICKCGLKKLIFKWARLDLNFKKLAAFWSIKLHEMKI